MAPPAAQLALALVAAACAAAAAAPSPSPSPSPSPLQPPQAATLELCAPPLGEPGLITGLVVAGAGAGALPLLLRAVVLVGASPTQLWDKTCGTGHGHAQCADAPLVGAPVAASNRSFATSFVSVPADVNATFVVVFVVPQTAIGTNAAAFADPTGGRPPAALVAAAVASATVRRTAGAAAGGLCDTGLAAQSPSAPPVQVMTPSASPTPLPSSLVSPATLQSFTSPSPSASASVSPSAPAVPATQPASSGAAATGVLSIAVGLMTAMLVVVLI